MTTFTNREARFTIVPALEELGELPLPIKGALRVRKIKRAFAENARDVEETRLESVKKYSELNSRGEIAWLEVKDDEGEIVVKSVYLKAEDGTDTVAREAFGKEFQELMEETFEIDEGLKLQLRHFPRDEPTMGKNIVTANLLFRLGDLIEDPDKKEKGP